MCLRMPLLAGRPGPRAPAAPQALRLAQQVRSLKGFRRIAAALFKGGSPGASPPPQVGHQNEAPLQTQHDSSAWRQIQHLGGALL